MEKSETIWTFIVMMWIGWKTSKLGENYSTKFAKNWQVPLWLSFCTQLRHEATVLKQWENETAPRKNAGVCRVSCRKSLFLCERHSGNFDAVRVFCVLDHPLPRWVCIPALNMPYLLFFFFLFLINRFSFVACFPNVANIILENFTVKDYNLWAGVKKKDKIKG